MVDAINPVAGSATQDAAVAARAAAAAAQAAKAAPAPAADEAKANVTTPPISPRFVTDTLSGALITEFTDDKGQVTAQYPSTAALNYLRLGLAPDGTRKADKPGVLAPAIVA